MNIQIVVKGLTSKMFMDVGSIRECECSLDIKIVRDMTGSPRSGLATLFVWRAEKQPQKTLVHTYVAKKALGEKLDLFCYTNGHKQIVTQRLTLM